MMEVSGYYKEITILFGFCDYITFPPPQKKCADFFFHPAIPHISILVRM